MINLPVFRIPIGFNADPDPAFYLKADPDQDPDSGSQTMRIHVDWILVKLCRYKKLDFYTKNLLYVRNMQKNILTLRSTKVILKGWKSGFIKST
jgi:hypothetical protein